VVHVGIDPKQNQWPNDSNEYVESLISRPSYNRNFVALKQINMATMAPKFTYSILIFLAFFFLENKCIYAQSEEQILSETIDAYNVFLDKANSIIDSRLSYTVLDSLQAATTAIPERLILLKLSTNSEIAKNARYHHMIYLEIIGSGYLVLGQLKKSRDILYPLESEINYFSEDKFPMRYTSNGKNFIINFSNFRGTKGYYYVSVTELYFLNNDYSKSLNMVRASLPFIDKGSWQSYTAYYYGISGKIKMNAYDAECINYCSQQLSTYYNLNAADLDSIQSHQFETYRFATQTLDQALEKGGLNADSYAHLVTAIQTLRFYLDPYKETEESQRKKNIFILLRWYNEAVMSNYSDKDFVRNAISFADIYADPKSNDKNSWLLRYEKFQLNCTDYQWLIDEYKKLNDTASINRLTPMLTTCKEVEDKLAAELEAARIKEEKKNSKNYKNSNNLPLVYLGLNLFPFIFKPRDFGLALNIGGDKMVTEFSYLQVNKKEENYFDLSLKDINDVPEHLWDGFYTHINLKFPSDDWNNGRARSYAGVLLSYNERTFEPFAVNILPTATNIPYAAIAAPTSKQYAGMINFGMMAVNGFGIDLFIGMGAAYNQFDAHLTEYESDAYVIEDALLENRPSNYWSFIMRMGISIGLGYAKE
jgi:hypothetical protein